MRKRKNWTMREKKMGNKEKQENVGEVNRK